MTNSLLEILNRKLTAMDIYIEASIQGIKFLQHHRDLFKDIKTSWKLYDALIADQVQIRKLLKSIKGDV